MEEFWGAKRSFLGGGMSLEDSSFMWRRLLILPPLRTRFRERVRRSGEGGEGSASLQLAPHLPPAIAFPRHLPFPLSSSAAAVRPVVAPAWS